MNMVDLSALYDEPLSPEQMNFTTKPGRACRSCIFERQRISVCDRAVALATKAGMPSCDIEDVVYVLRETDPRQIDFVAENKQEQKP